MSEEKPNIAIRIKRAVSSDFGTSWTWFWRDKKSFMGYLGGACVFVNVAVGLRILNMKEESFPQIPLILAGLGGFDALIFGINAAHSAYAKHVDAKANTEKLVVQGGD